MQDKFWPNSKIAPLPLRWPMLYLITDDTGRLPADMAEIIASAIKGGVNCVQFREKSLPAPEATRAFAALAEVCTALQVPLLLNGDLADRFKIQVPFAGYHFSHRTLPSPYPSPPFIAAYSAHSIPEAQSAFSHGIHFCTISPIFPTPSKVGILEPIGLSGLASACSALAGQKLVALGGINSTNATAVMQAGTGGIALIRDIWQADDPWAAARQLHTMMENCANPMNNLSGRAL